MLDESPLPEDLRESQRVLRESEQRYRSVVEHLGEGMFVAQNSRVVFSNALASTILRVPNETLLGSDPTEWIHPEDRPVILELRRRLQQGLPTEPHYEVRHIGPDGTTVWLNIRPKPVVWAGGTATLTFFSDITSQKQILQAMTQSEERYRAVVEHSGEGMVVVHDGRFVFVNRRAAELVQMTQEDMLREGYLHRIHPDDKQLVDDRRKRRLAGEEVPSRYEIRMLLPGGVVRWLDIGVTVVPWDGAIASLTFFSDITDRKIAQQELQRTASEREAIFNSALVGIVLSVQRELRWVNDKLAEMVGIPKDQLIGQSTRIFYASDADWNEATVRHRAALLETGVYSTVHQLQLASGASMWVQMAGRCVRDREPKAGVIWTFLDISERVRAEQNTLAALDRERELNELRSRFVAMTSHEFRTPLATILSSAELLRYYGERIPAAEKVEVLETIESSVQRMTRMLDRVLLLGKADAHMLEFNPRDLDLHALCLQLIDEARAQYPDSGHSVSCVFAQDVRTGKFDEKLLRHIFGNLLSNALKYSPAGGAVSFSCQRSQGRVVFQVVDQGIGIPNEEIPHLFESFHRASNVGDIQGTGLGLAIVKNAVQLHGGEIQVSSRMGSGTTFTVTL